jgi:hypothetical protein
MRFKFWLFALVLNGLIGAFPASAGGAGPLVVSRVSGKVEVKPLDRAEYWRVGGNRWKRERIGPVGRWRALETGGIVGTCLVRTGPRSWMRLAGKTWCVDPHSLVRVESGADFRIVVLRGRVSAVDGKRGKSLFREYDSGTREGVIR